MSGVWRAPASNKDASGAFVNSIQGIRDCLFGDLTTLKNNNARLQYQESTGHQTSFSYTYGDKYRGSRGCDQFHPLITCSVQTGPTIFYTTDHRWIASNALTIIGQYTHIHEDWFLGFQNDGLKDVQAINWVDTTYWDRSKSSGSYHTIRPQDDIRADGNYFASNKLGADHSVKFGFAVPPLAGGIDQHRRRRRRRPLSRSVSVPPGRAVTSLTPTDSATSKRACTIAGVSYRGQQRATDATKPTSCATRTSPTRCISATSTSRIRSRRAARRSTSVCASITSTTSPRRASCRRTASCRRSCRRSISRAPIRARATTTGRRASGITYDLSGNGKTILKASALALLRHRACSPRSALEPTGTTTTLRFPWKDLNGDKVVQANELQVFNADGGAEPAEQPQPATIQPSRASPISTSHRRSRT